MSDYDDEVNAGMRFAFGANWARFLSILNNERITQAEASLLEALRLSDFASKRFLDIGSGSGLFSLAARRMGAQAYSFDYDPQSVACTVALKHSYYPNDPNWIVDRASVLDKTYLEKLGEFDVVYSWGVLHHTGAMWDALANVVPLVSGGGRLFIAIYNDQGWPSKYWTYVKSFYNSGFTGK